MKIQILIIILSFITFSCSNNKQENGRVNSSHIEIKNKLSSLVNWKLINYKESIIDTNEVNILIPPMIVAELENKFSKKYLTPRLEFYPIGLKEVVSKKLDKYLTQRATFFPPAPRRYKNDKYFILIWDFEDYKDKKCYGCNYLELQLKEKLNMQFTIEDSIMQEMKIYE